MVIFIWKHLRSPFVDLYGLAWSVFAAIVSVLDSEPAVLNSSPITLE